MAHVDQDVGATRELFHLRDWSTVARVDKGAASMPQAEGKGHKVGLEMPRIADLECPFALA